MAGATKPLIVACVAALLGPAVACYGPLDPAQPVTLLIRADDFGGAQLEALRYAAEGWNLELGTQISVASAGQDGQATQRVDVSRSKGVCSRALGLADTSGPRIELCAGLNEPRDLLVVTRHEIGHLFGVGHVEDDELAVMWPRQQAVAPRFRPADRALFAEANPGFVSATDPCDRVHELGESLVPPVIVPAGPAESLAVWATLLDVRLQRLEPGSGRPTGPVFRVVTEGFAQRLTATVASDGRVHLLWIESAEGGVPRHLSLSIDALRGADASARLGAPRRLDQVTVPPLDLLRDLSAVAHGGDLFVATSRRAVDEGAGYWTSRTVQLHRLDARTGGERRLDYGSLGAQVTEAGPPLFWGVELARFVTVANEGLFVAQIERGRPVVQRLSDGRGLGRLELEAELAATDLVAAGGEGYLLLAWRQQGQPCQVMVQRVDVAGGALRAGQRTALSLPAAAAPQAQPLQGMAKAECTEPVSGVEPALAVDDQGARLVVSLPLPGWSPEVRLARLDARTLTPQHGWQRQSAVDLWASTLPALSRLAGGGGVVGWLDRSVVSGQLGVARIRCVAEAPREGRSD